MQPTQTLDADLQKLITLGKQQGYLTYDQVNDYLPMRTSIRRNSTTCSRRWKSEASRSRKRRPFRPS